MKLAIIGAGWLGMRLAARMASEGFLVRITQTSLSKIVQPHLSLERFIWQLPNQNCPPEIAECDSWVIMLPAGIYKNNDVIPLLVKSIQHSACNRLVFISSTGVYPASNFIQSDTSFINPLKTPNTALLSAEKAMESIRHSLIVRPSGLVGVDRNPAYYVSGRNVTAHEPINLIWEKDLVTILSQTLTTWAEENGVLVANTPERVTKKEYYANTCQLLKIPEPLYNDSSFSKEHIYPHRLVDDLNFSFEYPNSLAFPLQKCE